jgi:hypothetical protein
MPIGHVRSIPKSGNPQLTLQPGLLPASNKKDAEGNAAALSDFLDLRT